MKRLAFAAIAALLSAVPASADVVMPPPKCPRGQVGVTSHGGPRCEIEPPKDCPTGWDGALGGTCILTPCTTDADCSEGLGCVEHSVCLEPEQDDYYDYGEEEEEKKQHGELDPSPPRRMLQSPALLAGPMMPKTKRPTPITRYNAANLCSADVPCNLPRTCQPEKLCVPKGQRAVAYKGTNISAARVKRKTATPLTTSTAAPTEASTSKLTAPPRSGCLGCATTTDRAAPWGLALALGALGLGAWRRRR